MPKGLDRYLFANRREGALANRTCCARAVFRGADSPDDSAGISWETPSHFHPGAMAYATLDRADGACITVFLDRLEPMTEASPHNAAALLGHVLAHEMGHILGGTGHHSESGVLKDRWSQSEIRAMVMHNLSFTDYDRLAILSGIGVAARRVDPHQ
jgi:hypothetical protein